MAVFGRRQPHAPLVLRGLLPARPPVAVICVVGQKTSQLAADRYFRRSFPPLIVRAGGPKATAQAVLVQRQSQPAARRPQGRALVARAGGPAPTAHSLVVQRVAQAAARRPQGLAKVVTAGGPVAAARALVVQRVSQPAARRPQGRALGIRGGGPPAVGRAFVVQRVAQPAARRPQTRTTVVRGGGPAGVARALLVIRQAQPAARRPQSRSILLAPPRAAPPPVTAPIGVAVLVQRVSQLAARRPGSRVLVVRSGGRPAVGRTVVLSQVARHAAERAFRRSFPPVIRRGGGPASVARGLVKLAPSVVRPNRRPVLIGALAPASGVVLPAAGDVRLGVSYDANNLPAARDVRLGVVYG